jgi:hypothetical protein
LVLKPPHFNKWVNSFLDKRGATHHGHKIGANNRVFCLTPSAKRGAEAIAKALSRSVAFRGGVSDKTNALIIRAESMTGNIPPRLPEYNFRIFVNENCWNGVPAYCSFRVPCIYLTTE